MNAAPPRGVDTHGAMASRVHRIASACKMLQASRTCHGVKDCCIWIRRNSGLVDRTTEVWRIRLRLDRCNRVTLRPAGRG